jgi:hypothetical protein
MINDWIGSPLWWCMAVVLVLAVVLYLFSLARSEAHRMVAERERVAMIREARRVDRVTAVRVR